MPALRISNKICYRRFLLMVDFLLTCASIRIATAFDFGNNVGNIDQLSTASAWDNAEI
jgi:hypothetical protein